MVAALPVAGLLRFGTTPGSLFVVLLVAALTLAGAVALASVRVVVASDAVLVGCGPWGWPVRRVRAADIAGARVECRDPLTLGTLGYREPPGHAAVMVRGGECLVLELTGDRSLAVAVDGAESAAAVINERLVDGQP